MPAVLVPAGASLAAFVVTVFSWYGTLRNGIQLMHNDMHARRNYAIDVRSMLVDIDKHQSRVREWQRQWFIYEHVPEPLHERLWGEHETFNIREKLDSLAMYCNDAEKSLRLLTSLSDTRWRSMNKMRKKFLKYKFIATKKDYIQGVITRMTKDLDAVISSAEDGFRRTRGLEGRNIDFRKVYHIGVIHFLLPVAMCTRDDANMLQQLCCEKEVHQCINIHLNLDIFGSTGGVLDKLDAENSDTSFNAIAQSAKSNQLKWRFVIDKNNTKFARMGIERDDKPDSDPTNFAIACNRALDGSKGYIGVNGRQFRVFYIPENDGRGPRPANALRQLLLENKYAWRDMEQHPLGEISRFRVVFELSQACMLFLRTSWLSKVCSCGIQCRPSQSGPSRQRLFEFEVKMGSVAQHTARCVAVTQGSVQDGTEVSGNTLTRAMRRVGLLMVESILGFPITKMVIKDNQVTGIEFLEAQKNTVFHPINVVMQQIKNIFQKDDAPTKAIEQCLTTVLPESPTDEEMRKILVDFYHRVVAHLRDHYHELLENKRELDQNIRLALGGPVAG